MGIKVSFSGEFSLEELLDFKIIPQLKEFAFDLGVSKCR